MTSSRRAKLNMKKFVRLMPMRVLRFEQGDVLVMQTDIQLDQKQVEMLRDAATKTFGQFGKVAIFSGGLKLGILRKVKHK
jgi:hypothetical protein